MNDDLRAADDDDDQRPQTTRHQRTAGTSVPTQGQPAASSTSDRPVPAPPADPLPPPPALDAVTQSGAFDYALSLAGDMYVVYL